MTTMSRRYALLTEVWLPEVEKGRMVEVVSEHGDSVTVRSVVTYTVPRRMLSAPWEPRQHDPDAKRYTPRR